MQQYIHKGFAIDSDRFKYGSRFSTRFIDDLLERREIGGKTVFSVADKYLIACFESDVSDIVVKEIAKLRPYYAVFRDSSFATDSVAANFEQIFATYSPSTMRRVL